VAAKRRVLPSTSRSWRGHYISLDVLIDALVLSDRANFRVVRNPEAIRFDIVEVARSRFVWHRICNGRFAVLIASGR